MYIHKMNALWTRGQTSLALGPSRTLTHLSIEGNWAEEMGMETRRNAGPKASIPQPLLSQLLTLWPHHQPALCGRSVSVVLQNHFTCPNQRLPVQWRNCINCLTHKVVAQRDYFCECTWDLNCKALSLCEVLNTMTRGRASPRQHFYRTFHLKGFCSL